MEVPGKRAVGLAEAYAVSLAGRVVGTRHASSARHAVADYLRSLGCAPEEITPVGTDAAAWRGAVYRADRVAENPPGAESQQSG